MSILCQFLTKEIGYGVSLNTKSAYVKSDNLMSLLGGRVVVARSLSNMSNRLSMSSLAVLSFIQLSYSIDCPFGQIFARLFYKALSSNLYCTCFHLKLLCLIKEHPSNSKSRTATKKKVLN